MEQAKPEPSGRLETLPPLSRDTAFWGMTSTQFFGAFNDNLFKQLVLLLCVDYAAGGGPGGDVYQPLAQAIFAVPFVLFSGFGGFLSDRVSKQSVIVLCKLAEIAVMLAGMVAFWIGGLTAPFVVLFCMSVQSAFFGPSKYGILPEMLRERDLPAANGMIQMTTFLAIIFGAAAAGYMKEGFGDRLYVISGICVIIAIVGTATSLAIRKTPVAHPGLEFNASSLGINRETWHLLRRDRPLFAVLMISSLFWFLGGVVQQTVNAFGKNQMEIGDARTSLLMACVAVGIALGCALAGLLSHKQVSFRLVDVGAWGLVGTFAAMTWLGASDLVSASPAAALVAAEWTARGLLTLVGVFAGLFVVPLQVFLQSRPPEGQKGRVIGAMNLINWIGILGSAAFYLACTLTLEWLRVPVSWTFAATAVLMLPVAMFFRPPDAPLR